MAEALGTGAVGLLAKKAKMVENVFEKMHGHHSFPKFLGGDPLQKLTKMLESDHKKLHKELNDFLATRKNETGDHMRPQRGNSGVRIQDNFTMNERIAALKEFYSTTGAKFESAAKDFFNQL